MGGAGCRRPSSARLLYPLYGWGTRQHNDDDTNNISNISFNCVTRIAPQREQGTEDWKWKPKLATDASRATVHGPASTNVGSDRGTGLTKSLERGAEVFHDSTFTARGVAAGTEWSLRMGHMLSLGCAAAYFTDCQIQLFISRNRGLRYFFAGAAISSPTCQISTENMGSLSAELLINCARRTLHHLQSRSANCAGIFQESQVMGRVSGGEDCTVASLGAISQQRTVQVHAQLRTASASSLHSYRKDLLLPRSLHPTLSNNRLHRDYRTRKWHTSTHFISSREDMVCLTSARRQIALSGEHISRL